MPRGVADAPMRCPHCQSSKRPNWTLYAALVLAAVCVAFVRRVDREYRAVHQIRVVGDSILADWSAKQCVPRWRAAP